MRWQRPAFAMLQRWVDLTQGFQLRELLPVVLPVVTVGRDYPDNERASFYFADLIAGSPGEMPVIEVYPVVGAVELLAAWGSRSGGPLNMGMEFRDDLALPVTAVQRDASAPGQLNATIRANSVVTTFARAFERPQDTTHELPVRGTILTPGKVFRFGGVVAAQTLSLGVLVRNVGGP